jgi:hypothetical protein
MFEIFDRLPDDVLHSLRLASIDNQSSRKHFGNQRKLKKIDVSNRVMNMLDLRQANLTTVEVRGAGSLENLRGQNEITKFTANYGANQLMVDFICSEFSSLKFLNIDFNDFVDLSALCNLKSLKTFKSCLHVASSKTIRSKSLWKLSVYLRDSNFGEFSSQTKCPNLRFLIVSSTKVDIGLILLHFPRLERLQIAGDKLHFNQLDQHPLKHLQLRDIGSFDVLMKIAACCKDLVSLSTDMQFKRDQLKKLLKSLPNLKSLCMKTLEINHFDAIKKFGTNLDILHFSYYDGCYLGYGDPDDPESTWAEVKEELQERFAEFETKSTFDKFTETTDVHCLVKKTKASVCCCDILEDSSK